jgi:hypothetical protein
LLAWGESDKTGVMGRIVPNHSAFWKQNRFENAFELLCWASTSGELCDKVSAL